MEGRIQVLVFSALALCFLFPLNVVNSQDDEAITPKGDDSNLPPKFQFHLKGQVFCDTCRARFVTELSEHIPGASVRLECRDKEINGRKTFTIVGYTREKGFYSLLIEGEQKDQFCELTLLSSSRKDCDEIPIEGWVKQSLKLKLTTVNGSSATVSPMLFLKKQALPKCPQVFNKLGMYPPTHF